MDTPTTPKRSRRKTVEDYTNNIQIFRKKTVEGYTNNIQTFRKKTVEDRITPATFKHSETEFRDYQQNQTFRKKKQSRITLTTSKISETERRTIKDYTNKIRHSEKEMLED